MQVAFFVVMGGFVVDEEVVLGSTLDVQSWWKLLNPLNLSKHLDRTNHSIKQPRCRAILTTDGFLKLLAEERIHDDTLDPDPINDKNKGSAPAKTIDPCQALWLAVDCAARWSQRLPITLLELHVLTHVVRTAVIFFYWWGNPSMSTNI